MLTETLLVVFALVVGGGLGFVVSQRLRVRAARELRHEIDSTRHSLEQAQRAANEARADQAKALEAANDEVRRLRAAQERTHASAEAELEAARAERLELVRHLGPIVQDWLRLAATPETRAMLDMLELAEFAPDDCSPFRAGEHDAVGLVATADEERHGRVAWADRPGLRNRAGIPVRRAAVLRYRYRDTPIDGSYAEPLPARTAASATIRGSAMPVSGVR